MERLEMTARENGNHQIVFDCDPRRAAAEIIGIGVKKTIKIKYEDAIVAEGTFSGKRLIPEIKIKNENIHKGELARHFSSSLMWQYVEGKKKKWTARFNSFSNGFEIKNEKQEMICCSAASREAEGTVIEIFYDEPKIDWKTAVLIVIGCGELLEREREIRKRRKINRR